MSIFQTIQDWWGLLLAIGGGIGTALTTYFAYRKKEKDSTELLYKELEKLKKRIIEQVPKDIKNAETIAQQNMIISQLEQHCPDCYQTVINKLNNVEN